MADNHTEGFYEVFEVFSKRNEKTDMQYQFSLLAPNHEIALVMAQENFMRREPVIDIWVVKRSDIRKMTEEEKETLKRIDNKDYRLTKGYGYLKKKWREYEQGVLDEKEILSWGEDQDAANRKRTTS
ncbi:MAG TPA: 1,2-phenylacetyl-CoA epoxidase subunit PaaB [Bacillus sp. (in: firmicutes)]|uniref:1,2-phenylacetyl-CoA epoxidase subunit PaaB n=1 Tax=Bacillus litorisediminis TaxID=2922713 RepID=UPI001FAB4C4D|nr:1,2-phenylacetyl-CoA epoxidase subunit PaaB [Bacillus litorisediminis]HWO78345.1 1,2-phenylacetyl-CoA epoxidase subunit PaaB [Bacillus sp. (in: firmicutes)]